MTGEWGFQGSIVSDCDSLSDAHFAHDWGPGRGDGGNASVGETVAAGQFQSSPSGENGALYAFIWC